MGDRMLTERECLMIQQMALGMVDQDEIDEICAGDPVIARAYKREKADIEAYRKLVGEEKFHQTEFTISYSYDDDDDDD